MSNKASAMCVVLVALCLIIIGFGLRIVTSDSDEQPKKVIAAIIERPRFCAYLYNVGRTEEWFDCMGVGRK